MISAVLRLAVRDERIERNVAHDLDEKPSAKRQAEPRYLTVAEIDALLAKLPQNYRGVVAACAFAGLRISEALALRWSDIDFAAGTITIRAQLDAHGNRVPLKTSASCATLPMLPRLRAEVLALRGDVSGFVGADPYIFQTRTGKPLHRRNILRAVKREGGCAVHDLRHSFVSLALSAGVPVHEVSKLARHASPAVTLAVYAGIADHGLATATERIARSGFGA